VVWRGVVAQVKDKAKRAIRFDQFQDALGQLGAQKVGVTARGHRYGRGRRHRAHSCRVSQFPEEEPAAAKAHIFEVVLAAGGPALVGTSKAATGGVCELGLKPRVGEEVATPLYPP
jgi:hypothetical protein